MAILNKSGCAGPYKSEQEFKKDFIKKMIERDYAGVRYFCIETEETEPGFPDVMRLDFKNVADFYEMKITDSKNCFELQRSQPLFYMNNPDLVIHVVVWSTVENRPHIFTKKEIVKAVHKKCNLKLNIGDLY